MDKEWCNRNYWRTHCQITGAPEIHNSDQGSSIIPWPIHRCALKENKHPNINGCKGSPGQHTSNVFWKVDQIWKDIFWSSKTGSGDLYQMVREYIEFYNTKEGITKLGKVPPRSNFIMLKKNGHHDKLGIPFKLSLQVMGSLVILRKHCPSILF